MLEAWKAILEEIGPGTKIIWCKVCDPILCILTLEQIILAAGSDQELCHPVRNCQSGRLPFPVLLAELRCKIYKRSK